MTSSDQSAENSGQNAEPTGSRPSSGLRPPASEKGSDAPRSTGSRRTLVRAAVVLLAGGVAFAAWYFLVREPEPRNDLERFRGEWRLAREWEKAGGDDAVRTAVRVTDDRWQYLHGGGDGREYRITLNEQADPKEIDLDLIETRKLAGAAVRMRGVYRFDDDRTVRVRFGVGGEPRPKALDEPDAVVLVLTKVKLEPVPAPKER